jgi:hypothetical protein
MSKTQLETFTSKKTCTCIGGPECPICLGHAANVDPAKWGDVNDAHQTCVMHGQGTTIHGWQTCQRTCMNHEARCDHLPMVYDISACASYKAKDEDPNWKKAREFWQADYPRMPRDVAVRLSRNCYNCGRTAPDHAHKMVCLRFMAHPRQMMGNFTCGGHKYEDEMTPAQRALVAAFHKFHDAHDERCSEEFLASHYTEEERA